MQQVLADIQKNVRAWREEADRLEAERKAAVARTPGAVTDARYALWTGIERRERIDFLRYCADHAERAAETLRQAA